MSIETTPDALEGEAAIRAVVRRLSRAHSTGGAVIERAAILAEGEAASAIIDWILDHAGQAEAAAAAAPRGLHGASGAQHRAPLRYVLPPGALGESTP
jgi:ABC-type Fe3+ transport system substrate-binding protein